MFCPSSPPADGTPCPLEGLHCPPFTATLADYLCTRSLTWIERRYMVASSSNAADGGGDDSGGGNSGGGNSGGGYAGAGGEASIASAPAGYLHCAQFNGGTCPKECVVNCSKNPSGPDEGCAPACDQFPCEGYPPEQCPQPQCEARVDCSGTLTCEPHFFEPEACGTVGSVADNVACCAGLLRSCGNEAVDGSCSPTAGALLSVGDGFDGFEVIGIPQCLACGDGTCEAPENHCNCPSDCAR